jgi:hypothetical protein
MTIRTTGTGVALALVLVVAACGAGAELSDACNTARQEFFEYMDHQRRADNAFGDADNQWSDIYNAATAGTLSPENLAQGSAALDADLDRAIRQAARAEAALQRYRAARRDCRNADLPQGCRAEFRQHQRVIDHNQAVRAAQEQLTEAVTAQRSAVVAGDVATANAATDRHNAAVAELNRLVDVYNDELLPAYQRAQDRCDDAI